MCIDGKIRRILGCHFQTFMRMSAMFDSSRELYLVQSAKFNSFGRSNSFIKFIHDSQSKYNVSVDIENVPRYNILLSKREQIGYVTRAVNKPYTR